MLSIFDLLLISMILTVLLYILIIDRPARRRAAIKRRKHRRALKREDLYKKQIDFFNVYVEALIYDL